MLALLVGQLEDVVARRRPARCSTLRRLRNCRLRRDLGQHVLVDELHAHHDRRLSSAHWRECRRARSPPPPRRWRGGRGTSAGGTRGACAAARLLRRDRHRRRRGRATSGRAAAIEVGRIELNQFGSTLRWPSEATASGRTASATKTKWWSKIRLQPPADMDLRPIRCRSRAGSCGGRLRSWRRARPRAARARRDCAARA